MNGFLVLLCHTMDDLPISLHSDKEKAMKAALDCWDLPSVEIERVYRTDCSTPVCVKVVEFYRGKPVYCEVVKDFSEVVG